MIIFDLTTFKYSAEEIDEIIEYQDDLYRGISRKFLSERSLVKKHQLKFELNVVSVRHDADDFEDEVDCIDFDGVNEYVNDCDGLDDETFKLIHATLQKTNVLKPLKKRKKITTEHSLGYAIKSIEKEISNLDKWQKKQRLKPQINHSEYEA